MYLQYVPVTKEVSRDTVQVVMLLKSAGCTMSKCHLLTDAQEFHPPLPGLDSLWQESSRLLQHHGASAHA